MHPTLVNQFGTRRESLTPPIRIVGVVVLKQEIHAPKPPFCVSILDTALPETNTCRRQMDAAYSSPEGPGAAIQHGGNCCIPQYLEEYHQAASSIVCDH